MGAKRIAMAAGLVVIIAVALVFILRKSGVIGGSRPPGWVSDEMVERIDVSTGEVVTKERGQWAKLGHREGMYKNPNTGTYSMEIPMTCGACGEKIPSPTPTAGGPAGPPKCPKCGKNPYILPKK